MAVLIYYLIKFSKKSDVLNIRTTLAQSAYLVSQKNKCVRIVSNDQDNCIISALTNIIVGIIAFNNKFGYNPEVTPQDVKTSVTILLNVDIEHEIKAALKKGEFADITPPVDKLNDFDFDYGEEDNYLSDDAEKLDSDDASSDAEGEGGDYGDEGNDLSQDEYSPRVRTNAKKTSGFFPPGRTKGAPEPVYRPNMVPKRKGNTEANDFIQVRKYLERTIPNVKDPENIAKYILGATEAVKTARMNKGLKQNRVNFFATIAQLQ
jgi:hypothetical protein